MPTLMHLSLLCPTYPRSGKGGDLQESFDKFPTPGDNYMLQIPYILYRDSKINENSWTNAPTLGTKYADKSLQISIHCPTWGRWGLTMIGALIAAGPRGYINTTNIIYLTTVRSLYIAHLIRTLNLSAYIQRSNSRPVVTRTRDRLK